MDDISNKIPNFYYSKKFSENNILECILWVTPREKYNFERYG